jgi:hypothetical protein
MIHLISNINNKLKSFTMKSVFLFLLMVFSIPVFSQEELPKPDMSPEEIINIDGVFPHLSIIGDHIGRSETGIGALLPWANKLWYIGYVAHIHGSGIGLYALDESMKAEKHTESVTGTYANRMIHMKSNKGVIGPHIIDHKGHVQTIEKLVNHRLTATMDHLHHPDSMVYFLTMEGQLFETNVYTLETNHVFDLIDEFYQKTYDQLRNDGIYIHFKGGFTGNGRVIVANNSYQEGDYLGEQHGGRLAEWDGNEWTVLDKTAYIEVHGKMNPIYGNGIWATGWDRKSVKLMYYTPENDQWKTYRLPKGSQAWEHAWNTEWMRIREAQTERFMMDVFGLMYELPVMSYGGHMLPVKPICNHIRVIPDFTFWRGMFVMAGDQIDQAVGQPQSNLLFENIDDLWNYGKPVGWGSIWWEDDVQKNQYSDPFLMTGFDKKTIHITNHARRAVKISFEVDYMGNETWNTYKTIQIEGNSYKSIVFPDGYSAHWIRAKSHENAKLTVNFQYN